MTIAITAVTAVGNPPTVIRVFGIKTNCESVSVWVQCGTPPGPLVGPFSTPSYGAGPWIVDVNMRMWRILYCDSRLQSWTGRAEPTGCVGVAPVGLQRVLPNNQSKYARCQRLRSQRYSAILAVSAADQLGSGGMQSAA